MRRVVAYAEGLGPTGFILLIGLVAGTLAGLPRFFMPTTSPVGPPTGVFILVAVGGILWWTAAFLLWWIAVQRRQSSIWALALQITLGLILADQLDAALSLVISSIGTSGESTALLLRQPLRLLTSNLGFSLIRAPVWFVGSCVAIAMGRRLSDDRRSLVASPAAPTNSDP